ncbi:uncharacterized protein F5147DRAFT_658777, partial [Suillus discolor]
MSSSPNIPTTSSKPDSCPDQFVQDSAHHVKRNCDNRSIGPKSKSKSPIYDASQLEGLPPIVQHMSCYAKRASSRFKPYRLGRHVPNALEHRFMAKSVMKHPDGVISLADVQQGKDILRRGLQHMSDAALRSAVIAKRADAESKRLHALATAWDLESTERHAILLQMILHDNAEDYLHSLEDAHLFESIMVKRTRQQLEDDADFTVAAYSHDVVAHSITDNQLDQLEGISAERN